MNSVNIGENRKYRNCVVYYGRGPQQNDPFLPWAPSKYEMMVKNKTKQN